MACLTVGDQGSRIKDQGSRIKDQGSRIKDDQGQGKSAAEFARMFTGQLIERHAFSFDRFRRKRKALKICAGGLKM